jgi:hypothetical protein
MPLPIKIPAYLTPGKRFFDKFYNRYATITQACPHPYARTLLIGIRYDARIRENTTKDAMKKSYFEARRNRFQLVDWLDNPINRRTGALLR